MEDKIILICATGRSGSTTMQRIMNTMPNANICGENYGAINSLLEFYRRIKKTTFKEVPGKLNPASYSEIIEKNVKPAWYNSYNFEEIVNNIRKTIISLFKNVSESNIWGFKEIRYDSGDINYIRDFKELFPKTKVIIQIRENVAQQSKSSWHKHNKNAVQYLHNLNKELIHFYKNNSSYCYLTSFERMFDKQNLRNIFTFIDCIEYYNETKIDEVLNNNITD